MVALRCVLSCSVALSLIGCGRQAFDFGDSGTDDDTADTGESGTAAEGSEQAGGGECGNGLVEGDEDCDGDDLDGRSCSDFGFSGGVLSCSGSCSFDATGCSNDDGGGDGDGDGGGDGDGDGDGDSCGNGVIDADEECDGADFGGINCVDLGFGPGLPLCTADCMFDTSTCPEDTPEGQPCSWNDPCLDAYECVNGVCYDGSPGDPCEGDMDCLSDDCVQDGMWGDGTCA